MQEMPITPPNIPFSLHSLAQILADLRHPTDGCPWDREQDFSTIAPYTIEEAYEVADAIARNDMVHLREELGDLLLQVVYHARMAEEVAAFTLSDVVSDICEKMIRRHPHVYASAETRSADAQTVAWEEQKAAERGTASGVLDGVAKGFPALLRAQKLQKRAARIGFDWPDDSGPRAKIDEELAEFASARSAQERHDELGDILFSVVNYARHHDIDAETALRDASARFEARFARVEAAAGDQLGAASMAQLDAWWNEAKAADHS
jgi:nucleoside triphosphate diphosphatase